MSALDAGQQGTAVSPSVTFASGSNPSMRLCADKTNSAGGGVITESDEADNCGPWTNITLPVPLATPTGLTATAAACDSGTINVSWTESAGATSYTLRDNGVPIPAGTNITATFFPHTNLAAGSSHSYTFSASNSAGSSLFSGVKI